MSTVYYLLDSSKAKYGGLITSMEAVHKTGAHQADLSIAELSADRTIVKVVGDQAMLDKPDPQNVILEEYPLDRHNEVLALCHASVIQNPPQ